VIWITFAMEGEGVAKTPHQKAIPVIQRMAFNHYYPIGSFRYQPTKESIPIVSLS
jgi:hypothetical protein